MVGEGLAFTIMAGDGLVVTVMAGLDPAISPLEASSVPVNLEIVSPERLLLSRPVDMVVIPASEGDMGVLEGHTPMIVMLRGGVIALYEGERITDQMFVAGGFAEVTPERCTVLANEVMPVADLQRSEGERRLAEADAALAEIDASDVVGEELALERAQSARALIEAVDGLLTGR